MLQPLIMCDWAFGLWLGLAASLVKAQETGCSWDLVAHPPLIVPGQESVVFVAPKGCNFSQSSDDLMATLSIWDTSHHKVIHGMVWQVQPQPSFDTTFYGGYPKDVEIPPKVIMVPFRVPSSLPPSQGVLRLHSQRDCHPYVETRQIQDEKCPQNCTSKCLEIPFRLASSIRQILLIADKTDYQPGETVRLRYQVLDESTLPKKPAELTITIADASGVRIHTWNLGYLQRKMNENKDLFEEITFPLSPRCTKGKWIICAQDWPSIIDAGDKKKKYCINFHVKDQNQDYDDLQTSTSILSPESQTFESFVNLEMVAPTTFRTGVPYSGKVLTASRLLSEEEAVEAVEAMEADDDEELEVLVKLLEGGDEDNSSSSTSNLLDQQTLLINEEAVFNFAPIKSTSDHLTVEVYLQVPLSKTNIEEENVDTELEIDEVNAFDEEQVSEKSATKLLLSKVIRRESESSGRYDCPIWTQGLERTFKTGDFAAVTVKVSPACGCQQDLGLYWVLMRDDQFVAWGQQPQPTDENGECVYRFGLEMTSRMAPTATFKAFRPTLEGDFYATDEQNVTVNLEDRTLVILELNRTEVSHSSAMVGMEVFAEPESTICLRGRKMENSQARFESSQKKKESISDTFVTAGMIKVLEPVSKTWFFQCGRASEDGFYATWIRAPLEGGQWSVEAVSLSPFHGLRMAQPQPLLRTKPIHVQIDGIPALVRRGEILTNLTLRTRNNMPIPLKLTVIVSGSQGIFFSSESHFQTLQQNASGYESIEHQLKMHVNTLETDLEREERRKNISVLVTATALMEGRFVEVDSVHVIKEMLILPRGQRVVEHQLDYFCTSAGHSGTSAKAKTLDVLKIEEGQGGVNFSIKGTDEVVLLIEDPQSGLKFKMALGAQENSVTYLSLLSKEGEIRLDSQNTADILSSLDSKHFWLYWKLDNAHVEQLQLGLADEEEALVKWPVPVTFSPTQIKVLRVPESNVEIRFWHGQQLSEVGSNKESTTHEIEEEATLRGGGHNRIFHTTLANTSLILNDTITAQIILSDGFNLPLTESGLLTPLGSFHQMLDVLRDAATLSILERLQNVPKGHYTSSSEEEKEGKMHLLAQDLIYFRNVDGSFGEPLTRQTFSLALEQLWLMSEIENFYPLSAFMKTGLEKWLIKNRNENLNPEDVLLWAPRDSKVFHSLGIQAHRDCTENILNLRDEIGPMGLLRTQPFFSRTLAALSSVSSPSSNDTKLVEELLELYLRNAEWKKCQKSHFEELPYILWTMANLGQLNEPAIFECVHTHSQEMLSSPEVGYSVIRALVSSYQTSKKKLSKPSWKQDLKISLATSEDLGHSQTWRMTRGRKNKNQGDLFEPIVNHSIQHVWLEHPVPDKLFFLATGEGCGTVEVHTTYETMANDNSNSIYDVSLETSKDEDNIVFLTLCLKMKAEKASVATSVSVEFFTGYHFISSTSKDFWYHSWHRDHNVILHVSKVPSECGSCVTLKFTRVYEIDELAPAKLTVYPTMASSRAKEAYQQFFYMNGTLHQDMSSTTNDNFTLPTTICPCSYKCPKASSSEDSEEDEEAKVNMTVTKTTSTETTSQSTSINKEIEAIEAVEAVTTKMVANTSNDINGDIKLGAETISLASSTTTAAASTTTSSEAEEDINSDLTSLNDAV